MDSEFLIFCEKGVVLTRQVIALGFSSHGPFQNSSAQEQIEELKIRPSVRLFCDAVRRARKVSVESLRPIVHVTHNGCKIDGFNITVQGPSSNLIQLKTLLQEANLNLME